MSSMVFKDFKFMKYAYLHVKVLLRKCETKKMEKIVLQKLV